MIHICYCIHDRTGNYCKFMGTSIYSLLYNTQEQVIIHIIHDDTLNEFNQRRLIRISKWFNQTINFYNIKDYNKCKLYSILIFLPNTIYTIAALYRLLIPYIIKANKVIYLDNDTIINLNIKKLYEINIDQYILAASPEYLQTGNYNKILLICKQNIVDIKNYFNSGILVFNLYNFNTKNYEKVIQKACEYYIAYPDMNYIDQTILNYCFASHYYKLSVKYNYMLHIHKYKENIIKKYIYHYTGNSLGLSGNIFNQLWKNYYEQTPWSAIETIEQLQKIYDKYGTLKIQ